jgi:hypothetical protein
MAKHWIVKSLFAGLCGAFAHSALMAFKSWSGLMPTFQPYDSLQATLGRLIGANLHPTAVWLISFVSGATVLGFLFGRLYRVLPGSSGLAKGVVFGLCGWAAMMLLFFPAIGLGVFALNIGLGASPALFALAMVLTYSIAMGLAYGAVAG